MSIFSISIAIVLAHATVGTLCLCCVSSDVALVEHNLLIKLYRFYALAK